MPSRLRQYGLEEEMGDKWAMFSPTELLKLYVKEAFNREDVPAPSWNLRTWEEERIALGRDVFWFLKGATSGRYVLAKNDDVLLNSASPSIGALHDDFANEVDRAVIADCTAAIQSLSELPDKETQDLLTTINSRLRAMPVSIEAIHAFANDNEMFRSRTSALSSQIEQKSNAIANELLAPKYSERLQELGEALRKGSAPSSEAADVDDEEEEVEAAFPGEERSAEQDDPRDHVRTARSLIRYIQRTAETTMDGKCQRKHMVDTLNPQPA